MQNADGWSVRNKVGEPKETDKIEQTEKQVKVESELKVKLADILKILDDEEYTVSVFSKDKVDDKISESIANTAIIDFKKQLRAELISKFSE